MDLGLDDTGQAVFDRVFGGQHLAFDLVKFGQRGIKRRGLAAAGRAGDQHDAVRAVDRFAKLRCKLVIQAQGGEFQFQIGAVKNAHDHAFAVDRWRGSHAQIDFVPAHGQPQPAILRQALFGNVQPGHDLDARHHCTAHRQRQQRHLAQQPVDAKPHGQAVFVGFQMNVGCLRIDGLGNQAVDRANRRGVADKVAQPVDIAGFRSLVDFGHVGRAGAQLFDRRLDIAGARQHTFDPAAIGKAKGLFDKAVERVDHRHADHLRIAGNRYRANVAQEIGRQCAFERHWCAQQIGLRQRQGADRRQMIAKRLFGQQPQPGHDRIEPLTAFGLHECRTIQRFGGEQPGGA